jgi:Domain of unknown function (DUF222)
MFDMGLLPSVSAVLAVDDAGLIDASVEAGSFEAAVMARRLASMAELYHRRLRQEAERERLAVDVWDCVCAEIAAAGRISRSRASGLLNTAVVLRNELPLVAAVFAAGRVDYRVIAAVVSRVSLVRDPEDLARVDALLAPRVAGWNTLSKKKLADKIDWCVTEVDLIAKKESRTADEERHIGIGPDRRGTAEIYGTVRAPDAIAFDARLDALADTVCSHDPRTKVQRRADATGAMARGEDRLACLCGRDDCTAGTAETRTGGEPMIQVLASQATLDGTSDTPGYVEGYGPILADVVRDIAKQAKQRTVRHPGDAPAEPRYRPSAALADFIRCRDLTCRFPGCDVPAALCDIDHTVPYPYGPTHASNLKCMCRHDHLLKTFYSGPNGWQDRQFPDGTIEWTSPTGHVWTTKPNGALFFPQLARPTGTLILPTSVPPTSSGTLMMPTRDRTRAEEKHIRVEQERARNYKRLYTDVDPPPF